jgi:c-di-GMP-binding flagellar brake protein YcgR
MLESFMGNGLEKRKFRRLEYPLDVTIKIVSAGKAPKGSPPLHMKSRNISKAGICLESKALETDGLNLLSGRPGARENHMHLLIELLPDEPAFEAMGEPCWYDVVQDAPELSYQIGVEFIDITGDGRKQLERFLKHHKSDSVVGRLSDIMNFWRK